MDSRIEQYQTLIEKYSQKFKVPIDVISSVIIQESDGNEYAFAEGENSRGLMQISQNLALNEGLPVSLLETLFDPDTNIYYGAKHLSDRYEIMSEYFDSNISDHDKWEIVVSTYNQGTKFYQQALTNLAQLEIPMSWDSVYEELTSLDLPTITRKHASFYGPQVMSRVTEFVIPSSLYLNLALGACLLGLGYVGYTIYSDKGVNFGR